MLSLVLFAAMSGAPNACTADADCVVAYDCRCSCCPPEPEAMTKAKAKETRLKCARLGPCGHGPECAETTCPAPKSEASFDARCEQGACVLQPKPKKKSP